MRSALIMQRIYLLYPPISKAERYSSDIGEAGGNQIPLGIYYLAAYIRENGLHVKVTDAEAQKLSAIDILEEIEYFKPDYVGISSTTVAFHRALECAEEIKKTFPAIKIILGGPHVTSNVEHAMSYKVFDYAVIGEGEITLTELLQSLSSEHSIEHVKGIAYRKDDQLIKTMPREYITNLDILPFPAYDLIDDMSLYTPSPETYKMLPVMTVLTARGCPYQCTFCDRNIFGQQYRARSAENIFHEIQHLVETYHIKEIQFVDDTLFVDKQLIYKLFELLDNAGIFLHWSCLSRINTVDFEFLKFVKAKGCWYIAFGIESGDDNILKLIKKGITVEQVKHAISWCHELKIKTKGFFMLGHPGETIETLNKTVAFALQLPIDDIVATINTPIPGSPQYENIEQYGTLDKTDWAQFNYWRPVFIPTGLTQEILLTKQKELYRKFYIRPRILMRYLKSFCGSAGLKRFVTLLKASKYLLVHPK